MNTNPTRQELIEGFERAEEILSKIERKELVAAKYRDIRLDCQCAVGELAKEFNFLGEFEKSNEEVVGAVIGQILNRKTIPSTATVFASVFPLKVLTTLQEWNDKTDVGSENDSFSRQNRYENVMLKLRDHIDALHQLDS